MVFSGKIYDQVKEKLDKYLFGFDKSQLDVSLLKGKVTSFRLLIQLLNRCHKATRGQYQAKQSWEVATVVAAAILFKSRDSGHFGVET